MRLPYMRYVPPKTQDMRTGFGGLNLREDAAEGEFCKMLNLSSDKSPYVSPRKPHREAFNMLSACSGMYGCGDFLLYAEGNTIYRANDENDFVSIGGSFTDTPKQFVRMGAYVIIWPDKVIYNTETNRTEPMENTFVSFGEVTVTQSALDGSPSTTGTYMRVSCPGIASGFSQYDGIEISGFTSGAEVVNGSHVIYNTGDDFIVIAGIISVEHSQTELITVKRFCPDMDYIVESGNRLWGCSSKNHEIYASKLGDPKNWNCYMGIASDSYAATIGSEGDFTGAAAVSDTIIFFKENTLHKVLGTKPANYQITDTPGRGVMENCAASVAVVDEILFYLSREGVMAYDGSIPRCMSDILGSLCLREAASVSWQGKYIMNALNDADEPVTFVYDTKHKLWHEESNGRILHFAKAMNMLYCAGGDHLLTAMYDGTEKDEIVSWSGTTGRIMLERPGHKYVSKIILHIGCTENAPLKNHPPAVSVQYDGGSWEDCVVKPPIGRGLVYLCTIRPRRASYANIRIEGTGDFVLYGMSKTIEQGTELGRSAAR